MTVNRDLTMAHGYTHVGEWRLNHVQAIRAAVQEIYEMKYGMRFFGYCADMRHPVATAAGTTMTEAVVATSPPIFMIVKMASYCHSA